MILYNPLNGEVSTKRITYRPRSCFIMTKLGRPIPDEIKNIRRALTRHLRQHRIEPIDAESVITGRDVLLKILEMIVSCPLGIAIITNNLPAATIANIFYEIGVLQALGKETLVIRTPRAVLPSDFVRTEYIEYDREFATRIRRFLDQLDEQADHYEIMAAELERNPALALDYLKRAYLISGRRTLLRRARQLFDTLPAQDSIRPVVTLP